MATGNAQYLWEDVTACNFCGGTTKDLYMESAVPRWYRKRPLRLEACRGCGLVFASPRPVLSQLHGDYLKGGAASRQAVERKLKRPLIRYFHRKQIKTAIRFLGYKPQRLYDMGCGAGTTLMEAQALGIEAWGNDINKSAVEMLTNLGCHVVQGFSNDLELPSSHFDIVLNFDYLEHSYTPLEDLRKCFAICKPGGILHLKTLYLGCPDHEKAREAWKLFGPGHFHYFTPDVLQSMIESVGFDVVDAQFCRSDIFVTARRPNESTRTLKQRPKPRSPGPFTRLAQRIAHPLINSRIFSR